MATGLLSKPPTLTRVSPGVYRDASGKTVTSKTGKAPTAKKADPKAKTPKVQKLPGLTDQQNQIINQTQGADLSLGNTAAGQLGGIQSSYDQPFDWNAGPAAPVQGDFNQWRQGQIDSTYNDFTSRMEPQFKQQSDQFEQDMYNRGIPMGSDLYNRQKQQLQQQQNDARQSAMVQAMAVSGQNAGQFFDVGTQAHGNALSEAMSKRNMPLNEYNAITAAQSGMGMQNLGFSQQGALQKQGEQNQRWLMQNQPRGGGGGGGGGGGAGPLWQQYGFSSPMEYDAYKTAQARGNQQWEWQNNPQYQKPQTASPGASLLGAVGSSLLGGWAQGGFQKFW